MKVQSVSTRSAVVIDDLIFSVEDGIVWASWPGRSGSVELGPYTEVAAMMRDFLAQCDLGERLAGSKAGND